MKNLHMNEIHCLIKIPQHYTLCSEKTNFKLNLNNANFKKTKEENLQS